MLAGESARSSWLCAEMVKWKSPCVAMLKIKCSRLDHERNWTDTLFFRLLRFRRRVHLPGLSFQFRLQNNPTAAMLLQELLLDYERYFVKTNSWYRLHSRRVDI
ncbi:hypothetical protein MKEN_01366800 [Mycena kentingensis (nom. inval.)]|nr:hypothetical protein MKEN_01366800 [Mycena kentingensis (nom. inval.)]